MQTPTTKPNLAYDYLLFVGPGRSATTYIYHTLRAWYDVGFPQIKESYYYRRPRHYQRARRSISDDSILGDVANAAYMDAEVADLIKRMTSGGIRVLLVVTLREHVSRAVSMIRYATSRGKGLWRGGREGVEEHIVRKCLTREHLKRIYSAGADVIVLDYDALKAHPTETLNSLAEHCGIPTYHGSLPSVSMNASVSARSILFSAAATGASRALRLAGFHRTLQRIKDSQRVQEILFRPLDNDDSNGKMPRLRSENERMLRQVNEECWAFVRTNSESKIEGFYFRAAAETDSSLVIGTRRTIL